jgi:hypothetical protein
VSDPHIPPAERDSRSEQERVAELVRAVDVRAPQALHRRVQEMVAAHPASRRRARSGPGPRARNEAPGGGLSGALGGRLRPTLAAMAVAAIAGAAVALLTGGGSHPGSGVAPSVSAASRLTLSAASTGAPGESRTHSEQLDVAVDGVAFPYWKERFGWRATGTRTDTIGGRGVRTVFYSGPRGRRIGYAILAGTPAPATGGGMVVWRGGVPYRLQRVGGVPVVTWRREGRLCVLSGRGVSDATLVRLASWSDGGTAT